MMKKMSCYLCSFLLLIGLTMSCSSSPEYGKMIPKDALFVLTFNVNDAIERSELGDAALLKEQIDKSLAHAKMPKSTRDRLKEIMEDPQKTGLDFRQPFLFFAANSFPNKYGFLGTVSNQDDLEDFFQMLYKEGVCSPVLETDGLRYTTIDREVYAFNDEWLFGTKMTEEQQVPDEVLNEIRDLAVMPLEESLQTNETFNGLFEREGFMHLLYLGAGINILTDELGVSVKEMNQLIPENVNVEDFGLVCDANLKKGEAILEYEILPLTEKAATWLDETATSIYGNVDGALVNYIPSDAFFYGYGNLRGTALYEQLKSYPDFVELLQSDEKLKKMFDVLAEAFDGDVAFYVGTDFTATGVPEISFYADTKNQKWLQFLDKENDENIRKIDDRTYEIDVYDSQYSAFDQAVGGYEVPVVGTIVLGAKKGISYVLYGKSARMFEEIDNPITIDSSCTGYLRLNANQLLNLNVVQQQLGPIALIPFKKVVSLFDYAEYYLENGRKGTFRIVMADKKQSPLKTIYDEVEKILQVLG